VYGYYPSVWYVSSIDWSANPVLSYTTTGPETGDRTSFIDSKGAGTCTFEVTFINRWTDCVAHGPSSSRPDDPSLRANIDPPWCPGLYSSGLPPTEPASHPIPKISRIIPTKITKVTRFKE